MPRSPAPIPIASPRRSRAAGSARPASTQSRFAPGSMPGRCAGSIPSTTTTSRRCELKASAADFSYTLRLDAERPLVLQGDGGYSRKSLREQASYYYSQPHYTAKGVLAIDDKPVEVTGQAWLDREWSSQPLASDQSGWDWLSLHLRCRRQADAVPDAPDRRKAFWVRQMDQARWHGDELLGTDDIVMTPLGVTEIEGRKIPTSWRIAIAKDGAVDRVRAAQRREAGWARAFPIGKARSALPAAMPD